MSQINSLIDAITKKFTDKEFDKFIHEINFPKFKSFAPNTKISLDFPVTVLVGPNGGGKSSILQAAWGMPLKYSTSRFWFSTPVDPMDFDSINQNRYWYAHYVKKINQNVECRKMCGNKRHGYWEPTRPSQQEGMKVMPPASPRTSEFMSPSGDRWNQVKRTPYYINSKAESSAFERFFYSSGNTTLEARQDYFVKYSRQLKSAIDKELKSLEYYGVERIKENFVIPKPQLDIINNILKKNYKSARYISHALYDKNFSPSVIFETEQRRYSECFAGSGELAVVNCVLALEKVKKFDLLLLDEPETSLHPGAQTSLLEYILGIVKTKLIQVIISTHSHTFVELLPTNALIVLDESPEGIVVRTESTKASAFRRLGHLEKNKITVVTEDKLLETLVKRALERVPPELSRKTVVFPADVGASEMLSNQVRAYSQTGANVIMVLDGDQSAITQVFDIDPKDLSTSSTEKHIKFLKDNNISIVGSNQELNLELWIKWCKKRVVLIDDICPEQLLLELINEDHPLLKDPNATNKKFKDAVRGELKSQSNDRDSSAQASLFKYLLGNVKSGEPMDIKIASLAEKLRVKLVELEKQ